LRCMRPGRVAKRKAPFQNVAPELQVKYERERGFVAVQLDTICFQFVDPRSNEDMLQHIRDAPEGAPIKDMGRRVRLVKPDGTTCTAQVIDGARKKAVYANENDYTLSLDEGGLLDLRRTGSKLVYTQYTQAALRFRALQEADRDGPREQHIGQLSKEELTVPMFVDELLDQFEDIVYDFTFIDMYYEDTIPVEPVQNEEEQAASMLVSLSSSEIEEPLQPPRQTPQSKQVVPVKDNLNLIREIHNTMSRSIQDTIDNVDRAEKASRSQMRALRVENENLKQDLSEKNEVLARTEQIVRMETELRSVCEEKLRLLSEEVAKKDEQLSFYKKKRAAVEAPAAGFDLTRPVPTQQLVRTLEERVAELESRLGI
jgi:hypothetical protein